MYKKFLASAAILAAATYATSAGATTTVAVGAGPDGTSLGAIPTQVTFDEPGVTAAAPGSVTANVPAAINGATFSGGGIIMNNPAETVFGMYAEPAGDVSNYLAVVFQPTSGTSLSSPVTITLPGSFFKFGLFWGSVDTYNTISFSNGDSFVGLDIHNPANGDQGIGGSFYALFTSDHAFNTITLATTQNSFEVDNLFWGDAAETRPTPLPGALPLFISGLSGLGFLRFWRKKKQTIKMAAA